MWLSLFAINPVNIKPLNNIVEYQGAALLYQWRHVGIHGGDFVSASV